MQILDENYNVIAEYNTPHRDKVRVTSFRVVKRLGNKPRREIGVMEFPK